jgi:SacI homology domain
MQCIVRYLMLYLHTMPTLCACTHTTALYTNRGTGGLRRVTTAVGIVGFVRFLGCFYLTLITQRKRVGAIGGNLIYAVRGTETFPVRRETAGGVSSSSEEGSSTVGGLQGDAQLPHNAFVNVWSKVSAVELECIASSSQPKHLAIAVYSGYSSIVDCQQ